MTSTAVRVFDDVAAPTCYFSRRYLRREYYFHHLLLRARTCAALSRLTSRLTPLTVRCSSTFRCIVSTPFYKVTSFDFNKQRLSCSYQVLETASRQPQRRGVRAHRPPQR